MPGQKKPKPTIRQLEEHVQMLDKQMGIAHHFIQVMAGEMDKMHSVLMSHLRGIGLIDDRTCAHCEQVVSTPLVEGIFPLEDCPACGKPIDGTTQTTLAEEE